MASVVSAYWSAGFNMALRHDDEQRGLTGMASVDSAYRSAGFNRALRHDDDQRGRTGMATVVSAYRSAGFNMALSSTHHGKAVNEIQLRPPSVCGVLLHIPWEGGERDPIKTTKCVGPCCTYHGEAMHA